MNTNEINNLNETIAQALHQLKTEQGDRFSLEKVNLAELSRRTGISRKRLRNAKKHGFRIPASEENTAMFFDLVDRRYEKEGPHSSL